MIDRECHGLTAKQIALELAVFLHEFEFHIKSLQIEAENVLFYIDGTNGSLFCSIFDFEKQESIGESIFSISLMDLWEELDREGYGGYDFDLIVLKGIKKALKTDIGKRIKKGFTVFVQTVEDDPKKIK